jgi:porphobilinogen synthase
LRRTSALRRLTAEVSVRPGDLILPMFVAEVATEPRPISSMPRVVQHSLDSLAKAAVEAVHAGVGGLMLFGVPASKDALGSGADDPNGILNAGLARLKFELGDATVLMGDLCLDEFTDHGHCGVLKADGSVDNDATLRRYASMALAQAEAGADLLGTSGMMDGQVGVVRAALDAAGRDDVGVLAYAPKYASAFYGPFREAADSAPAFGDRRSHQMDPANAEEAIREVALDIEEGADIVMVKPALAYLDVIARVKAEFGYPTAAYQVSGEYAMLKAAARNGWIDEPRAMMETLTSIRRAGADIVITYYAREAARALA